MKATDVFTPGAFPAYTYVERADLGLEDGLRDALATSGQITSLAGPSKSGKTVLVEKVVGTDNLIAVSGAGVKTPDDIWTKVLSWMGTSAPVSVEHSKTTQTGADLKIGAKLSVLGIGGGSAEARTSLGSQSTEKTSASYASDGLTQVKKEIANSDYVVLVDDFHYMDRAVQAEAAKALKEAVRLGIKICTAAVLHRSDDVVRANPELRGRVRSVDLAYWKLSELAQIGMRGFDALNCVCLPADVELLAREAAGSPQLMQLICLNACFVLNIRERLAEKTVIGFNAEQINQILEQTSANTNFKSLIDVLDSGPRVRGTERKTYKFKDGSEGDVYRCVLKALASDPPRLSFTYDDLLARTVKICEGEHPSGSSIVGTCKHIVKLAEEKFPTERVIDWDEQKQIIDIPDPYLLFYMRWSGRLEQPE